MLQVIYNLEFCAMLQMDGVVNLESLAIDVPRQRISPGRPTRRNECSIASNKLLSAVKMKRRPAVLQLDRHPWFNVPRGLVAVQVMKKSW